MLGGYLECTMTEIPGTVNVVNMEESARAILAHHSSLLHISYSTLSLPFLNQVVGKEGKALEVRG